MTAARNDRDGDMSGIAVQQREWARTFVACAPGGKALPREIGAGSLRPGHRRSSLMRRAAVGVAQVRQDGPHMLTCGHRRIRRIRRVEWIANCFPEWAARQNHGVCVRQSTRKALRPLSFWDVLASGGDSGARPCGMQVKSWNADLLAVSSVLSYNLQ